MSDNPTTPVLLVDPSRFTVPYDAGLTQGLMAAGIEPIWATRPLRAGEKEEFPAGVVHTIFYRRFDKPDFLPRFARGPAKALAHLAGLYRLIRLARQRRVGIVHFQWTVLPIFDAMAILVLRRFFPVLVTMHDSIPYNGQTISFFQEFGYDLPSKVAQRVIVHTGAAKAALVKRNIPASKIVVIPHGPLFLKAEPRVAGARREDVWTFTMFGKIKPYKGVDVLIEALGQVQDAVRGRARFLVCGTAYVDIDVLRARINALGIGDLIDLRIKFMADEEMADLFEETDCFLFPYRQIDASGVYFLTKPLGKWIIASRVGIFAEDLLDGRTGTLVPPGQAEILGQAIVDALNQRSRPAVGLYAPSWEDIGRQTAAQYALTAAAANQTGAKPVILTADGP